MTLIVEDGSGVADANGYVALDACAAYATARGLTFVASPSADGQAAIIRATAAIDGRYRGAFPGYRTHGRGQTLEWPRLAAYDCEGWLVAGDEIPQELIDATCEAAVRELADPGVLMPDLERGGAVRRLKAGSVEIEYGANAENRTLFSLIDGILTRLLGSTSSNSFAGRATRG